MKNLSIFEPQIEKHHAYKKKHVLEEIDFQYLKYFGPLDYHDVVYSNYPCLSVHLSVRLYIS